MRREEEENRQQIRARRGKRETLGLGCFDGFEVGVLSFDSVRVVSLITQVAVLR